MPIALRSDFDAATVRAAGRQSKDGAQTRSLLALAAIYEGSGRTEAARIGGVTLQIVRKRKVTPPISELTGIRRQHIGIVACWIRHMLHDETSLETNGGGEPPVRRLDVVSGPGGRRRWTRESKMRIIEQTLCPGANVAAVARRHGLVPHQLYGWRSAVRARKSEPGLSFVPLAMEGAAPPIASGKPSFRPDTVKDK